MTNVVTNVVGTDGKIPIYDPDALWRIWSVDEIFHGTVASGRFVPKVRDYVIDPQTFETWIVDELDNVTMIPTLRPIQPAGMPTSFKQTDILFGVGPGTQADTYRVYLDKSVMPYVLAVDVRLKVAGTMTSYAKIVRGPVNVADLDVISKVYDSSGMLVSDKVPLELASIDGHTNYSIKTVQVCHTTEDLPDGEIVTAIFYSDNGHVVSKRQLLVENTGFIRAVNSGLKYISHISLDTPFLSPSLDNTIEYPLNIPINALNLMGKVHYSNGEIVTLPVNGTKFRMYGIDQYTSSIIGQKIDLVLSYALSPGEVAYGAVGNSQKFITEPYKLVTMNPNNSYTVKLFGYPFWVDSANGYQMHWYLLNLDRNVYFDVTNLVTFDQNTGAFDPKGYGYMQRKSVSVNLKNVSGVFKPFIHTQVVEIVLKNAPQPGSSAWTVSHESNSSRPVYGEGIHATKISDYVVNLASGFTNISDWIENVYSNTFPLINPNTETKAPQPTHFVLTYNGISNDYPIDQWNQNLSVNGVIQMYKTMLVRFIKRTASGDMLLAVSAMMVRS